MGVSAVKALTFDVFGTVVDWRSTIIREGERLGRDRGIEVDWARFADAWRAGYGPAMDRVRSGELPWTNIDTLHRMILDGLLDRLRVTELSGAEKDHLNRVWHRLTPWPDAVAGLQRLRTRFVIATLSNGNVALLTNMAKQAGLPWDCILSSEFAKRYKPDAKVLPDGGGFAWSAARPGDDGSGAQAGPERRTGHRHEDGLRSKTEGVRPRPRGGHNARPLL